MDIQDIARWVVPVLLAAAGIYYVKRVMGRVSSQGAEKLARFGLAPVPGASKGGSTFQGRYRGIDCGYHWGDTAILHAESHTGYGTITSGSELWASLGFDGPPLAIVERGDKGWKRFEGGPVPRAEVLTGDPVFDQRFSLRCEDPAWAREVATPRLRAHLLGIPLVFLAQTQARVIFCLYFDGTRLFDAFGVPMKDGWALMDRANIFLDAAILLVEEMSVARQA